MSAQQEIFEEQWDKRKIAIGVISLVGLVGAFFGARYVLGKYGLFTQSPSTTQSVQGAQTTNDTTSPDNTSVSPAFSLPSASAVADQVAKIQDQVTKINLQDIASSSPQIQQIIQQIQDLPKQPGTMAKDACIQICNKL